MDGRISELVARILELLEEQGEISKADIDTRFAPTPEEYAQVKRILLGKPRIESGERKVGGFHLRTKRPTTSETEDVWAPVQLSEWERLAAGRLDAVLTYADLETLLSTRLQWTVRAIHKYVSGEDRRLRKGELIAMLLVKHGVELLQDSEVRHMLCKGVNTERRKRGLPAISNPGRWHPGKDSAAAFVAATELPKELVGVPSEERPPDYEYLEGRLQLGGLEEFQREILDKSLAVLEAPGSRAIATLPTGAGKTRTAVEALQQWLTRRHRNRTDHPRQTILWLAHTEELCEQAYACFRQVWQNTSDVCPLHLVRFWGSYTADLVKHENTLKRALGSPSAFISTPHRLANLIAARAPESERAIAGLRNAAGAVVIDEAHRAGAPTYSKILTLFAVPEGPAILGLTATPFRKEYTDDGGEATRELRDLFAQQVIEPVNTLGDSPREALQAMGILAKPLMVRLETSIRLTLPLDTPQEDPSEQDIEKIDHKLKLDADRAQRRILIRNQILDICRKASDTAVLYFGPTVEDAEQMAFLLRQEGYSSAVVSGKTRDSSRRQIIAAFRQGDIRVLCNCEVLTTGFDAPRVTHVVVGRPTVSQVLYEQMVGRGLRGPKFGGTEYCTIVNCEDDYREQRPTLGYVGWKKVWKPETRNR